MNVPSSVIAPSTAAEDQAYVIAFIDDDWDHWSSLLDANLYRGWRSGHRWHFASLHGGANGDWTYDDSEVVVIRPLP